MSDIWLNHLFTSILESEEEELILLAKEEIDILSKDISDLEQELKILLIPKDPNDNNNTITNNKNKQSTDIRE